MHNVHLTNIIQSNRDILQLPGKTRAVFGQLIPLGHVTTGSTYLELEPDSRLSGGQMRACVRERERERERERYRSRKQCVCVTEWRRTRRTGESSSIQNMEKPTDAKDK